MTLCQGAIVSIEAEHSPASVSLLALSLDHVADAVSRGAEGAAVWRAALDAVFDTWSFDASVIGPRRRRTLEGASTTSHADIRWLPQLLAAEHT